MTPTFDINELTPCIEQVLDTGSDSQWARLTEILNASADSRRYYVRYMQVRSVLVQNGVAAISRPNIQARISEDDEHPELELFETMMVPGIIDVPPEPIPAEGEIFQPAPAATVPVSERAARSSSIGRLAAVLAVGLTAALITGVLLIRHPKTPVTTITPTTSHTAVSSSVPVPPSEPVVARITRSIDAMWSPVQKADGGGNLHAATHLSLTAGYVELSLEKGAKAIVEAPAEFTVISDNQLDLVSGRLSATVPEPAHGFSVSTPQGTLTDLGTEFGIQYRADGTAQFDVFKGSVKVVATSSQQQLPGKIFVAGQAAFISDGKIKLDPEGTVSQRYVRTFTTGNNRVDLVDLISGGDGTTQQAGVGINANTGEIGKLASAAEVAGDGKYHRVTRTSVVDGCCVPNGSNGPVQIDSLGHTFAFPPTTGHSFNQIWTGGKVPWPAGVEAVSTTVDGIDYAADPHHLMIIHSNQAVTLDLAAIRRLHPGENLSRFQCTIANSYNHAVSHFDVFIIVDGVAKLQRKGLTNSDGKLDVDIPIQATDRFLTLATTDGDMSIWGDWAIWCDPGFATVPK